MTDMASRNEKAVEAALAQMKQPLVSGNKSEKSFAPPEQRGIHALIEEVEELVELTQARLKTIKARLSQFDDLQRKFYNGQAK
jgi:hypothetical protein